MQQAKQVEFWFEGKHVENVTREEAGKMFREWMHNYEFVRVTATLRKLEVNLR